MTTPMLDVTLAPARSGAAGTLPALDPPAAAPLRPANEAPGPDAPASAPLRPADAAPGPDAPASALCQPVEKPLAPDAPASVPLQPVEKPLVLDAPTSVPLRPAMQPPVPDAPASAPLRPAGPLGSVDLLLRDRTGTLERIRRGEDLAGLARTAILTIAGGAAAFGAAMGAYRGGVQVAAAGLKLALVVLLTAAVCAPALTAIHASLGRPASLRRDLALVLAALARAALVLAAEAPLLLLAVNQRASYHSLILLTVACCTLAGLVGVALLVRGLGCERTGRWLASLAFLAVFAGVGAQMSWTFRPYLVRPRTVDVPLLRGVEDDFFYSVRHTLDSARGVYRRAAAPVPGETGAGR